MNTISLDDARNEFPGAIRALVDGGAEAGDSLEEAEAHLDELLFWKDERGWLHCDDRVHPAFDDMWNPLDGEWQGSDLEYPDQ